MTGESSQGVAAEGTAEGESATSASAPTSSTFQAGVAKGGRAMEKANPHSVSDGTLMQKRQKERRNGSGGNSMAATPAIAGGPFRPRSLFTSHSFKGMANIGPFTPMNEMNFSPRVSPTRNWNFADSPPSDVPYFNRGSGFSPVYYDTENDTYSTFKYDRYLMESSSGIGATVTSQGIISLRLHSGIQVDTTIDKGIRIVNSQSQIIISLSPDGNSAALIHPSGLVYAYGSRVEVTTTDCNGNTKFAKMFYKGVSFTSDTSALIYLVDQAGTRTISDTFSDLGGDFSIPVFLHNAHYGSDMIRECTKILRQSQYWIAENDSENWVVNGIRVTQTADGLVRVGRGASKYQIRTSPTNGTASITTPSVHTTASIGTPTPRNASGPHLFVKKGERRLHSNGLTFIVRNAGHASGFDEFNKLKVY